MFMYSNAHSYAIINTRMNTQNSRLGDVSPAERGWRSVGADRNYISEGIK